MITELENRTLHYDMRHVGKGQMTRQYRPMSKQVIYDIFLEGKHCQADLSILVGVSQSTMAKTLANGAKGLYKDINSSTAFTVTHRKAKTTNLQKEITIRNIKIKSLKASADSFGPKEAARLTKEYIDPEIATVNALMQLQKAGVNITINA